MLPLPTLAESAASTSADSDRVENQGETASESNAEPSRVLRVSETVIERTDRAVPEQSNSPEHQYVYGGELVRQPDGIARVSAMTLAGAFCVTARIDHVEFKEPIPAGNTAEMTACVHDTENTSLGVYVSVDHRDPRSHGRPRAAAAQVVFVTTDRDRIPVPVPDICTESEAEREPVKRAST